jgi:predicted MPP superfamily phosphohydrolase
MSMKQNRRDLLKLAGLGGVVYASNLIGCASHKAQPSTLANSAASKHAAAREDFFFLQLSDTHWGYSGAANPEAEMTLKKTVEMVNASSVQPDFIIFTGDLTHNTDDAAVRRKRMGEFKQIVSGLKVKTVKFIPGEHDASADKGAAFRENFGDMHYAFDHKGIHFIAIDNVSDPGSIVGDEQIAWIEGDLKKVDPETPVVVFTHRPLFDLYPQWEWATKDGDRVVSVLSKHKNVTVFYGHIHQENHHMTGHIAHHSAKSLIFALPAPGSVPKKAPVAWDPAKPGAGLGYRSIGSPPSAEDYKVTEMSVERKA